MPYLRDADLARIKELVEAIKEIAAKEEHPSIRPMADRTLEIIKKYTAAKEY